jgi:hypothetical protein
VIGHYEIFYLFLFIYFFGRSAISSDEGPELNVQAQEFTTDFRAQKHEDRAREREDGMVLGDDNGMRGDGYEEPDPEERGVNGVHIARHIFF